MRGDEGVCLRFGPGGLGWEGAGRVPPTPGPRTDGTAARRGGAWTGVISAAPLAGPTSQGHVRTLTDKEIAVGTRASSAHSNSDEPPRFCPFCPFRQTWLQTPSVWAMGRETGPASVAPNHPAAAATQHDRSRNAHPSPPPLGPARPTQPTQSPFLAAGPPPGCGAADPDVACSGPAADSDDDVIQVVSSSVRSLGGGGGTRCVA